jgi:hypothetical protein
MLMLSGDTHEHETQTGQMLEGRDRPVDHNAVPPLTGNGPLDEEVPRAWKPEVGQLFMDGRGLGEVKKGLHPGLIGAVSNQIRGGPASEDQVDRIDDDGFSRAGLSGDDVEARSVEDIQVVDNGKIGNGQLRKHTKYNRFAIL